MIEALSVYLLAGGESSRMGLDKGLIELHGKPIIGYIIDAVKQLTNDITIITSNDNYKQFKLPIIEDVYKNMGPASGIDTALHDAKKRMGFHYFLRYAIYRCDVYKTLSNVKQTL
ncbi:MAG: NTP transferase domain-containing protein [Bacteroidetes bacterium]|nr:NTP transferase domain-containing protein [Bacteroidota bacterium]